MEGHVSIVMLTHEAKESNIREAMKTIEALDEAGGRPSSYGSRTRT
jgi:hypothetical protein